MSPPPIPKTLSLNDEMLRRSHYNILMNSVFETGQSCSVTSVALVEWRACLKIASTTETVLSLDALAKQKASSIINSSRTLV